MRGALAATDAMVGLAQAGYGTVVADEECTAEAEVLVARQTTTDEFALREALVEMGEYGGNIQAVGAGHAILAGGAGYGIEAEQFVGYLH